MTNLSSLEKELRYNQIAESALKVQGFTKYENSPDYIDSNIKHKLDTNHEPEEESELDFNGE